MTTAQLLAAIDKTVSEYEESEEAKRKNQDALIIAIHQADNDYASAQDAKGASK